MQRRVDKESGTRIASREILLIHIADEVHLPAQSRRVHLFQQCLIPPAQLAGKHKVLFDSSCLDKPSINFDQSRKVLARLKCFDIEDVGLRDSQPDSDSDQFVKPPEQHEGDVGVTKGSQQEHIPAVLGAEAAGDEEGAAFDKDQERADGEAEGRKKDDAGAAMIWRVV